MVTTFFIGLLIFSLICLSTQFNIRLATVTRRNINPLNMMQSSYKVQNLKKSVAFYTKCLGMQVSTTNDKDRACLGYEDKTTIELVEIDQTKKLDRGDSFIGIGVCTKDANSVFLSVETNGGSILRAIGDYSHGASMFPDEDEMKPTPVRYGRVTDPDGYVIEVKENKKTSSTTIEKVVLKVLDLNDSISFFEGLGLTLLRKRSNVMSTPKEGSMSAYLGHTSETEPYVELFYPYAFDKLVLGNGFNLLSIESTNSDKGIKVVDPNGYSISIV